MLRCSLTVKSYLEGISNARLNSLASSVSVCRVGRGKLVRTLASSAIGKDASRPPRGAAKETSSVAFDSHINNSQAKHGGGLSAVDVLTRLLSDENTQSVSPELQTPRDFKSLYISVKSKNRLERLSSNDMSSLIHLFGTLSILSELPEVPSVADSDNHSVYAFHPLAFHLSKRSVSGAREHWSFVLTVAKDKQSLGRVLNDSDNFWLMRAALQDLKRISLQEAKDERAVALTRARARNHYLLIKPVLHYWVVHKIYLEGLLAHGGLSAPDEVVHRLGIILKWSKGLHWHLQDILWRVLALPEDVITPATKAHFLRVLRGKITKVRDVLPEIPGPSDDIDLKGHGASIDDDKRRTYDALAIRNYFVDIMFSPKPGIHPASLYLHEVYPWALFETRAALRAFNDGTYATSDEEDSAAWNNLVLLSLSFSVNRGIRGTEAARVTPGQSVDGVHSQSQVLGWTVICALTALSSELHLYGRVKYGSTVSPESIQDMARTLWILWRKEEAWKAGAVARSTVLVCSATTSFMALASVSGDARLASALLPHLRDSVISPTRLGETVDHRMLVNIAAHYVLMNTATLADGSSNVAWGTIFNTLRSAQLIPDGESKNARGPAILVANAILRECIRFNPALAHELYKSAADYGLAVDGLTALTLGKAFASDGHIELATDCLKNNCLSRSSAQALMDTILSNTLRFRRQHFDHSLALAFAEVFTDTPIRPTNGSALERVLRACLDAGHVKEAFEIIQVVNMSGPTVLRSQFLAYFVSTLVSHRHYRLLGRVLKNISRRPQNHNFSSILRQPRFAYIQQLLAQPGTGSRLISQSAPFSIYVWPLMRDHIPFHPRLAFLDKKILSLKLSSSLRKRQKLDEQTLEHAVYILVGMGRITSALKLLDRFSPTISTRAGNIILNASLRPRRSRTHYRQIRYASARLTQLVGEKGFVPDRVTLNIVMKSLLRWQNFAPKATLRALFSRLVAEGYPGHEVDTVALSPALVRPAATPSSRLRRDPSSMAVTSSRDALPVYLKGFKDRISFKYHTRPLYRMFVKAFKVRGDREGVRHVLSILRELKMRVAHERAQRAQARYAGRIKARSKGLSMRREERAKAVKAHDNS
ncbi:hypothetical protein M0805_007850 [Coniferiporia weirii]|nr:hypothetical protein M0805_007850 [Coniferiporia weirii]